LLVGFFSMMRIALISDIHSNRIALRPVLADIRRTGVDHIVCLGDVANLGPEPNAVIEILADLGCPCIMGNHDEFLLDSAMVHTCSDLPLVVASVDWSRGRLSAVELEFIRNFQRQYEIPLGRDATLRLFHGSPRSNMENVLVDTPSDLLDEMLTGATATVMAGGHTHIQMLRQHHGTLLVNPGSVGLAFKDYGGGRGRTTVLSHAEYAIIAEINGTLGVDLRRVPLDRYELRQARLAIRR